MKGRTGLQAHDYYGRLRAFAIMLLTNDEQVFCDCYAYCTGYDKPIRTIGHYIWHRMQAEYLHDLYHKRYVREKQEKLESCKKWKEENKERCNEYSRKYRAKKKGEKDVKNEKRKGN